MRPVVARTRDQRHMRRPRTDEAGNQIAGGPASGAVVQAHVGRARAIGQVGYQSHRRHALLRQRVDGLAHRRMLQRHERDAVRALAVLGQRLRKRVGIEALDVLHLAPGIERRKVLLGIADRIAQHAQVAVAAARQQKYQPQRLGRGGGSNLLFRQIVQLDGRFEDLLRRAGAHARPAVQDPVGRGGRHASTFRHIGQARQLTFGGRSIHIKIHH